MGVKGTMWGKVDAIVSSTEATIPYFFPNLSH